MRIAEMLMPEFEQEMANTRRVLERVTDDLLDWKAHPKSNSVGWVACHLAEIPGWVTGTLTQDNWDIHPVGGEPYRTPELKSRQAILDAFDANVASAKQHLAMASDAELAKNWSLLSGGQVLLTSTKLGVIRTWVLNHTIHHRAHLCVYLRLSGLPVPGMYGPSGDE